MGSSGKKKTTMAKLAREGRLRERRAEKERRKVARKNAPLDPSPQIEDQHDPDSWPDEPAPE
jgi:hypothetical protein